MTNALELTHVDDPTKLASATPGYKVCAALKSPRCMISHCREEFRPPQILTKNAKVWFLFLKSWLFLVFKIKFRANICCLPNNMQVRCCAFRLNFFKLLHVSVKLVVCNQTTTQGENIYHETHLTTCIINIIVTWNELLRTCFIIFAHNFWQSGSCAKQNSKSGPQTLVQKSLSK